MKVNALGMLMKLLLVTCAVNNFAFLSAIPLSDEQTKSADNAPIQASNETVSTEASKVTPSEITASENASVEDTLPPLVFPSDGSPSQNDTALKILQSVTSQDVKSSEETKTNETTTVEGSSSVENVTLSSVEVTESSKAATNGTDSVEMTETEYDNESQEDEDEKTDVENIQDNSEKQTELEEQFAHNGSDKTTINLFQEPVTNEPVFHSGHFAAMFAGILVAVSALCYIGLVLWRRRLESRYGMSQRLVTSDDYYNNNDIRYFGL